MANYNYPKSYASYNERPTAQGGPQVFPPPTVYSPSQSFSLPQQTASMGTQNNFPSFICRPVASYEEATATPTDFNGNILILTDFFHGMIYTKILDPKTGNSVFSAYQYIPPEQQTIYQPETGQAQYAPFSYVERLESEIKGLREELEEAKKLAQKEQIEKGLES